MKYKDFTTLNNQQLLEAMVRERNNQNTIENAMKVVELSDLFYDCDANDLRKLGLTESKSEVIMAVQEIYKRLNTTYKPVRKQISAPSDVVAMLGPEMRYMKREKFVVLYLSTKNEVLNVSTISIGTLNASLVHPREVLKEAIKRSANGIILCHNHPSFNHPDPSDEDKAITTRIKDAANIIGISLLDHIIISGNQSYSFKEQGMV